jgi:hypothetical protein
MSDQEKTPTQLLKENEVLPAEIPAEELEHMGKGEEQ